MVEKQSHDSQLFVMMQGALVAPARHAIRCSFAPSSATWSLAVGCLNALMMPVVGMPASRSNIQPCGLPSGTQALCMHPRAQGPVPSQSWSNSFAESAIRRVFSPSGGQACACFTEQRLLPCAMTGQRYFKAYWFCVASATCIDLQWLALCLSQSTIVWCPSWGGISEKHDILLTCAFCREQNDMPIQAN